MIIEPGLNLITDIMAKKLGNVKRSSLLPGYETRPVGRDSNPDNRLCRVVKPGFNGLMIIAGL